MNLRLSGNAFKSAVIDTFLHLLHKRMCQQTLREKVFVGCKNLSFHGATLKFRPVCLSERRKANLFIVCKYSTREVGFKCHMF